MTTLRKAQIHQSGTVGTVYLLHFKLPYRHCRHYIGFTSRPLETRLGEHWRGNGAALTAAVHAEPQNALILARTWTDVDQSIEMILKSRAESPKLCPICNPDALKYAVYETKGTP